MRVWPLKDTGGVMDIQKERKAFEKALVDKCGFNPESSFSVDDKGEYKSDATHFGWAMWQAAKAQAVPEGFVLVPKEPTEEMCHRGRNTRSFKVQDIYKAMIEAQEQSHD